MKVGAAHYASEEQRAEVERIIAGLTWHEMPVSDVPACPGLAIREVIAQLDLPKVTRVAWGGLIEEPDPADPRWTAAYELLGIEANYSNGTAQLYVLDKGGECTPLCADFEEKAVAA